jgi:hypothetical protein
LSVYYLLKQCCSRSLTFVPLLWKEQHAFHHHDQMAVDQ